MVSHAEWETGSVPEQRVMFLSGTQRNSGTPFSLLLRAQWRLGMGLFTGRMWGSRDHSYSCIMIISFSQRLSHHGLITYLTVFPHNLNFTLPLSVSLVLTFSYNVPQNIKEWMSEWMNEHRFEWMVNLWRLSIEGKRKTKWEAASAPTSDTSSANLILNLELTRLLTPYLQPQPSTLLSVFLTKLYNHLQLGVTLIGKSNEQAPNFFEPGPPHCLPNSERSP